MNQEISNPLAQSQKKHDEHAFSLSGVEKTYDKYFKKITELQAGDIIIKHNCKLCNSEHRSAAEMKWEQTKGNTGRGNISLVLRYLNEQPGDMKYHHQNVANHIDNHYEQQQKRIRLREYGERLADMMNWKIDKDHMFEGMTHAIHLKLYEAASDPELEISKQADIMAKLTKAILDIQLSQAKLRGEVDTIDIYKQQFQNIIVNLIMDEGDKDKQRKMLERLDQLKEEVSLDE